MLKKNNEEKKRMNSMCKKYISLLPIQVIHYSMVLNICSIYLCSINALQDYLISFLSDYLVVFNVF